MKHALLYSLLFGLFCLLPSGCVFQEAEELFAIPRTSETYQNLQETVHEVMQDAKGISPLSGNHTQTLQLVDLDNDGTPEAIAFFRNESEEWPLKIAIFKQQEDDYQLYAQIHGAGNDIECIEYQNLVEDQSLEILVSWQVSPSVRTLVAYSIHENQVTEVLRSGYSSYLVMPMHDEEHTDLLLLQKEAGLLTSRVELYTGVGGVMEFHSSAPLSEGITTVQVWEKGLLTNQSPCFMVTSELSGNKYTTDIFALKGDSLQNITLDSESRISLSTLRQHTGVLPTDINADGISEIPISTTIPSPQNGKGENFWNIEWKQFNERGYATTVLSTYHNNSDRWYLSLPSSWKDNITLHRPEHTTAGERAVVFSHWQGDDSILPVPFLSIYRLTGNNRHSHATEGKRFILTADADTIYAAEFHESSWQCGLDKNSLIQRFHPF